MNTPSLAVILVGGWGAAPPSTSNLFYQQSPHFLGDFISAYPTLCLENPGVESLEDAYKLIGASQNGDTVCLNSMLESHNIQRVFIADADRYGLFEDHLRCKHGEKAENEKAHYIPFPPAANAQYMTDTTMPEINAMIPELLKDQTDTIFFIAYDAIWTACRQQNEKAVQQAIMQTNKKLTELINKLIAADIRVLVVSDSAMAEEIDESADPFKPTTNLLPCILIDRNLEGLKASEDDSVISGVLPSIASGSLKDIAPTIFALMGIAAPGEVDGIVLFKDCIANN